MDKKANLFYSGYSELTPNDIGNFIGKELSSTEQAVINSLIQSMELHIARNCNRNFLHDLSGNSYYQVFDAGKKEYCTFNLPIKEITKIELDGDIEYDIEEESNDYVLGSDFFVYDEGITFYTITKSSINDRNALKIYYTIEEFWGEDVKLAIKRWVSEIFLSREYGGKKVTSFNFSGYSLDFSEDEIPEYIKEVISNYKKPII